MEPTPTASYEDIASRSDDELRRLLHDGAPANRVYAAWALGMRSNHSVFLDLGSRVHHEPAPGVRRHFIILLTGAGKSETIATLAAHDPDPGVRATACQYLARLAGPRDLSLYEVLMERAAEDPAEEVRCAAIANLRADAPMGVRALVVERFPRESLELQKAAFVPLAAWSETPGAFLAVLSGASPQLLVDALRLLRKQNARIAWSDVKHVAQRGDSAVLMEIAYMLRGHPEHAPRTFWLSLFERWDYVWLSAQGAQDMLVGALECSYANAIPESLPAEERKRLNAVRKEVEHTVRCGVWGAYDQDWIDLINLLRNPGLARTMTFRCPLGRLLALLILVTPDYEGFTEEELHEKSMYWLR